MRILRLIIILSIVATSIWVATAEAAEDTVRQELVVLNWEEYLDPELVAEFEQAFNAKVREVYFETDNERDKLLLQSSGAGYDIAIVNGTSIEKYKQRGWLAKIDEARMPNLRHIYDRWRSAHNQASDYAVPYFWGTTGIAYRSDLIDTEVTSWMDLMKPPEAAKGRVAMIGDSRDLAIPALLALGFSPNSGDPAELAAARALLLEQRPHVRSYTYVSLDESSSLVTGEVTMALMWSGDALVIKEYNENINYVVPKEGTILWVDYLAILEASRKKQPCLSGLHPHPLYVVCTHFPE